VVDGQLLTEREQDRLDDALGHIRTLHYLNFCLAGVALALSSLDVVKGVSIPSTGIDLPRAQAAVGLFLVTIGLSAVIERLFRMSATWLDLDPRRPPFPWFAFGNRSLSNRAMNLWILAPAVVAALGAGVALGPAFPGWGLMIPSFVLVFLPAVLEDYWHCIRTRTDKRGGPATFSIWLLYWFRLGGCLAFGLLAASVAVLAVPSWRGLASPVTKVSFLTLAFLEVPRFIGSFTYRLIDRLGVRRGFPPDSPHYRNRQKIGGKG
jgi:hypothetical protein